MTTAQQSQFTIPQRIADGLHFIVRRKPAELRMERYPDGYVTTWRGGPLLAANPILAEWIVQNPYKIPWPLYWVGYDEARNVWYITRDRSD